MTKKAIYFFTKKNVFFLINLSPSHDSTILAVAKMLLYHIMPKMACEGDIMYIHNVMPTETPKQIAELYTVSEDSIRRINNLCDLSPAPG